MKDFHARQYTGEGSCPYAPLEGAVTEPEPYVPNSDLVEAVNMALYLRRPLLLEGEPGCGKTRLAFSVAHELGYPLYEIYIRSTSKAQDLLYTFDAVRRLYDLQEQAAGGAQGKGGSPASNQKTKGAQQVLEEKRQYVEFGELGKAIERTMEQDEPSVVLIDEIDKADMDFPNDLLLEMDRWQFSIKELNNTRIDGLKGQTREQRRDVLPLVIVTSNREKELPPAFLRRCLFYYIPFPTDEEIRNIMQRHVKGTPTALFDEAVKKFWTLRDQEQFTWQKKPSTSELLDWVRCLSRAEGQGKLTAGQLAGIPLSTLPHLGVLVKRHEDQTALKGLTVT
ncbi:MAG: MoxR family ATPase [Nitrospira sp.]|nr:MoxR family ATPase [Nitrospira sp.]